MPYQIEKPYVVVNGQRMISPNSKPQRLPFCDRCDTLAATSASFYTELSPKWWQWPSFPKFSCQEEAFMGCEAHPVESEIQFLDGHVERFDKIPPTRWQRLSDPYALVLAIVFAIVIGVAVGFLLK